MKKMLLHSLLMFVFVAYVSITLCYFIVTTQDKQDEVKWRCVEYKGQYNPDSCTLYRRNK